MDFLKKWDIYGKPVTFYYNTSTVHKTYFGALLSIISFSLMMSITVTSLINFLYQKPSISSNIVYFINKKFAQLDAMAIHGKLRTSELEIEGQLDTFVKYFRIVLHEKYFDEVETFHVAKLIKTDDNLYEFNVTMSISDVFKEKEFSTLKIMTCKDIEKIKGVNWADPFNETTCEPNFENYFNKRYISNEFLVLFDAPNYTIDRKGSLREVPHQNELFFKVSRDKKISYLMETKYVVIEDDTNIYYTHKKYDAYFTMKRPVQIKEENYENDYTVEILMQNDDNDQIVLISLYKYKLLDFLAKLGGIMKIITFMKMTGKFWSSFFYEQTLYKLLVKRDNIYLSQKKKLLESFIYKNTNNIIKLKLSKSDNSDSNFSMDMSNNLEIAINNNKNETNSINSYKNKKKDIKYASYYSWFMNRFCKFFFVDSEAKQKREMLAETLGLNNYLLHLDYIDRQILLEQHYGDINEKIEEIIIKNKEKEKEKEQEKEQEQQENNNINDKTNIELNNDIKEGEFNITDISNENDMKKPFNKQ